MADISLVAGTATDVGRVRTVNQDALLATASVFVVADGMGGHHGGEVASRFVVEEFSRLDPTGFDADDGARAVREVLCAIQVRIEEYGAREGAGDHPWYSGTTAVAGILVHHQSRPTWLVANVGDSRAYRFAHHRLEQISVDHSLVQELLTAGKISAKEAESHPERHVVTRALGGPQVPEADLFRWSVTPGERLLLCSDGITGLIDDAAIARVLAEVPEAQPAAERLVAAALAAGGLDNATAVVVDAVGSHGG